MSSASSDWNTVGPSQSPRVAEFPAAAAAAFGKKKPSNQVAFSDKATNAFSRPSSTNVTSHGFSDGAASAFSNNKTGYNSGGFSDGAATAFSSHKTGHTGGGFPESASAAFNSGGGVPTHSGGFGDQAASAFGKKRQPKNSTPAVSSPLVTRRNDSFGALLSAIMPTIEAGSDYSNSALRYKKPDASPKVMTDEMFPSLSPASSPSVTSPKVSFADVIRKRAQNDEIEAQKMKEETEAERRRKERERLDRPSVHAGGFLARRRVTPRQEEEEDEPVADIHDLDYVPPHGHRKEASRVYEDHDEAGEEDDGGYEDAD